MSTGSKSQFPRSCLRGDPGGKRVDGLGEGRKRGVFDTRREGTGDSEDEGRLEALAGEDRLCHAGVMNPSTQMGRTEGRTHL